MEKVTFVKEPTYSIRSFTVQRIRFDTPVTVQNGDILEITSNPNGSIVEIRVQRKNNG